MKVVYRTRYYATARTDEGNHAVFAVNLKRYEDGRVQTEHEQPIATYPTFARAIAHVQEVNANLA